MRGLKSISLRPPDTRHSEIFQVPWSQGQIALQGEQFLLGFSPGQPLAVNRGRSWGELVLSYPSRTHFSMKSGDELIIRISLQKWKWLAHFKRPQNKFKISVKFKVFCDSEVFIIRGIVSERQHLNEVWCSRKSSGRRTCGSISNRSLDCG